MSDAELRDPVEIITLTDAKEKATSKCKFYRAPIVVYGVVLLIVAGLSLYGGFMWGVDRKTTTETKVYLVIGRACIDYVHSLRPRKAAAKPEAAIWIARNCERIAEKSLEKIRGSRTAEVRRGA